MKIKIFQINSDRDSLRVKFTGLQETQNVQLSKGLPALLRPGLYDEVYSGDVDCQTLEDVYTMFNINHPPFFRGHSLSVSDIVQVTEATELVGRIKYFDNSGNITGDVEFTDSKKYNQAISDMHDAEIEILAVRLTDHHVPSVQPGFYFCDSIGFEKINFNPDLTLKPDGLLRVVAKEPGKSAYEAEVANKLRAFQQAVNGYIETFCPFDDNAVIICNEEGKMAGMETNCVINGELLVGTIFIIGDKGDGDFCSLTDGQTQKYLDMFRQAEIAAKERQAQENPAQDGGMQMT